MHLFMGKESRKRNIQLQKASTAKSEFLSRMSHDMRTPLNGMLGMTAILQDETDLMEVRRRLRQIDYSGQYLLNLINDTLDVNKIEAGKLELHTKPIDISEFVENMFSNAKMIADKKNIQIVTNIDMTGTHEWKNVIADGLRVEQIFLNLISNAVKFSQEGQCIEVEYKRAKVTDSEVTGQFVIRDHGIGMSQEFIPHLFEPFTQEGRASMERESGTGLGMSIVKQLIQLMGGIIRVESKVNCGTKITFTLTVPIYHGTIEKSLSEAKTESLKGKRILLFEDHPINREIAITLLKKKKKNPPLRGPSDECNDSGEAVETKRADCYPCGKWTGWSG